MKKWLRIVLLIALTGAAACEKGSAPFGRIPRIVSEAQAQTDEKRMTDRIASDRIYRKLLPHFGQIRGKAVPFTVTATGYEVLSVTIGSLRRSCDISAQVTLRPGPEFAGKERLRLYFLALGRNGSAFARGIVIAQQERNGNWHGEANFHMLLDAAGYRHFDRMVFVSRDKFHAAADEIRKR